MDKMVIYSRLGGYFYCGNLEFLDGSLRINIGGKMFYRTIQTRKEGFELIQAIVNEEAYNINNDRCGKYDYKNRAILHSLRNLNGGIEFFIAKYTELLTHSLNTAFDEFEGITLPPPQPELSSSIDIYPSAIEMLNKLKKLNETTN